MKKIILVTFIIVSYFNSNAQDSSLTKMVLQDPVFQKMLDSLGLLEDIQTEAEYDDSHLRGILPLVF